MYSWLPGWLEATTKQCDEDSISLPHVAFILRQIVATATIIPRHPLHQLGNPSSRRAVLSGPRITILILDQGPEVKERSSALIGQGGVTCSPMEPMRSHPHPTWWAKYGGGVVLQGNGGAVTRLRGSWCLAGKNNRKFCSQELQSWGCVSTSRILTSNLKALNSL